MKREDAIAYEAHLNEMPRRELVKEAMYLKRRVDKLSCICDVEDTYRALIEQEQSERKAERLERQVNDASNRLREELRKRNIQFNPYDSLARLSELLIECINQ